MIAYRALRTALEPVVRRVWRLDVVGLERLPAGPCVIAPNHDSLSDPFFVGVAIPRPLRMLGKAELFRFPLRGLLLSFGAIPVTRGEGDQRAIGAVVEALRAGDSVVIHPQGTTLGAANRRWRRGAARVAIQAGVPVVPVALVATERVLRPRTVRVGFPVVTVVVGAPIDVGPPGVPTEESAAELTDRIRHAVEALRAPYYP